MRDKILEYEGDSLPIPTIISASRNWEHERMMFVSSALQGLLSFGVPAKYATVQALEAANLMVKKLKEEAGE